MTRLNVKASITNTVWKSGSAFIAGLLLLGGCVFRQDYKASCARWHADREEILTNFETSRGIADTSGLRLGEETMRRYEELKSTGTQDRLDAIDTLHKERLSTSNVLAFCKQYIEVKPLNSLF